MKRKLTRYILLSLLALVTLAAINVYKLSVYINPYWTIEHAFSARDVVRARNFCERTGEIPLAQQLITKRFSHGGAGKIIMEMAEMYPETIEDRILLAENLQSVSAYIDLYPEARIPLTNRLRENLDNQNEFIECLAAWSLGSFGDGVSYRKILGMSRAGTSLNFCRWLRGVGGYPTEEAYQILKGFETDSDPNVIHEIRSILNYRKVRGFNR